MRNLRYYLALATIFSAVITYLASADSVLALQVIAPNIGIAGNTNPGTIISSALTIAYIVAVVVVLFFLVIGAFNWITSGGDKERVGKARGTIVHALVGLTILALALVIVAVASAILKINILSNFNVPNLEGNTVL